MRLDRESVRKIERNRRIALASVIVALTALCAFLWVCTLRGIWEAQEAAQTRKTLDSMPVIQSADTDGMDDAEELDEQDPLEWLKIQAALVWKTEDYRAGRITKEELTQAMGYDYDYVVRVVMAEAGHDSEDMQMAICQCIINECMRSGCTKSPYDVARDAYTAPASYASAEVWRVCNDMFIFGTTYVPALDALYMYNSGLCEAEWHESKPYVMSLYDIYGNEVRFFGEEGWRGGTE